MLEAAAMEFVEHGYDKAVVSNIARRAGVTTGAIYARWPHKSDVMVAALDHIFEQLLPAQRLRDLGIAELSTAEITAIWGADLLNSDETKGVPVQVLVQVFGSARNNEAVRARLQRFLDDQADQLSQLVERAKDEGCCDPELSTAALTLLLQAIGTGTHLLMSPGRDNRHVPVGHDWTTVLLKVLGTAGQQAQQPQTQQTQ